MFINYLILKIKVELAGGNELIFDEFFNENFLIFNFFLMERNKYMVRDTLN